MECDQCNIDGFCGFQKNRNKRYVLLQGLVDKATPKKPILNELWKDEETTDIYDEFGHVDEILCVCPNCKKVNIYDSEYGVKFKHCSDCGQAIDWSDKDENNQDDNKKL